MKYGVLWRKTTKNIGDDMQSYAASLFLPSVDYMVDIEELDSFVAEDDEPVATIMSAWYMWHKWNWPPTKSLYPMWLGFHYDDLQRARKRGMPCHFEYLESGPGFEYLKAYEPIGCRDPYTMEQLDRIGIKNYFSACVTLTLPKRPIVKPEKEYIVCNDVGKKVLKAIKKQLKGQDVEIKVIPPTRKVPSTDMPWEERKKEVEDYLDIYQNAKCVITKRLHCALPCLALETPVLLVRKNFDSPRFAPYKDWMKSTTQDRVIAGEFKSFMINPEPNPTTYLEYRDSINKAVTEFIDNAKKETRKASELVRTSYTPEEVMKWQNETMKMTLHNFHKEEHIDIWELAWYHNSNVISKYIKWRKKLGMELPPNKDDEV
ncbi:polysaccharide pyruvyl transferase family protein [Butyrivibrio sp. WCD2001]|uniref:polysaccharide pyruvyl transferase family protein n=1 Tax=Butyrivibrio sp. WCD2001 TaxID=1280681 RepID=UPI000411697A|nr:polysaccharide pyruvyl transferase family protein [Butyrivibrio sp. WCD2001]